jgi:hypothetical protein
MASSRGSTVRRGCGDERRTEARMTRRGLAAIGLACCFTAAGAGRTQDQTPPPDPAPLVTVTVDALHPWVDSGLTVSKGERLSFVATGSIQWGSKPGQVAGPEGHGAKPGKLGAGGLIGRVGLTGKPFPIGSSQLPLAMRQGGKLLLGINDFIFKDNAGSFVVRIFESGATGVIP